MTRYQIMRYLLILMVLLCWNIFTVMFLLHRSRVTQLPSAPVPLAVTPASPTPPAALDTDSPPPPTAPDTSAPPVRQRFDVHLIVLTGQKAVLQGDQWVVDGQATNNSDRTVQISLLYCYAEYEQPGNRLKRLKLNSLQKIEIDPLPPGGHTTFHQSFPITERLILKYSGAEFTLKRSN